MASGYLSPRRSRGPTNDASQTTPSPSRLSLPADPPAAPIATVNQIRAAVGLMPSPIGYYDDLSDFYAFGRYVSELQDQIRSVRENNKQLSIDRESSLSVSQIQPEDSTSPEAQFRRSVDNRNRKLYPYQTALEKARSVWVKVDQKLQSAAQSAKYTRDLHDHPYGVDTPPDFSNESIVFTGMEREVAELKKTIRDLQMNNEALIGIDAENKILVQQVLDSHREIAVLKQTTSPSPRQHQPDLAAEIATRKSAFAVVERELKRAQELEAHAHGSVTKLQKENAEIRAQLKRTQDSLTATKKEVSDLKLAHLETEATLLRTQSEVEQMTRSTVPGIMLNAPPAQPRRKSLVPTVDYGTLRARLVRFYERYNPDRIGSIDSIVELYVGNEAELFESLIAKYGPEP